MTSQLLFPGQPIALPEGTTAADIVCGPGVTQRTTTSNSAQTSSGLVATLVGEVQWTDGNTVSVVAPVPKRKVGETVTAGGAAASPPPPASSSSSSGAQPTVGALVHFRVHRVTRMGAAGLIIAINGRWCSSNLNYKGNIRVEDIKPIKGVEQCVVADCFRAGDIVLAEIVALADTRQYQLNTVKPMCGVIRALPSAGGGGIFSSSSTLTMAMAGDEIGTRNSLIPNSGNGDDEEMEEDTATTIGVPTLQPIKGSRTAMRCPVSGQEVLRWTPSETTSTFSA